MNVVSALVCLGVVVLAAFAHPLESRAIPVDVYDNLAFYFKYASSAYLNLTCPKPNGNTLVTKFSDNITDTQGFVARDDSRKEVVVALRGSSSLVDFITDVRFTLTDLVSPGMSPPAGTTVHSGFLSAWNSVANSVIATVRNEINTHKGYTIVTSGHSLGGALSSLAASSLKQNFQNTTVTMYTYGQPRTGNPVYAMWVNDQFETKAFRGVHTSDGVSTTFLPTSLGYMHHGLEYWTFLDPSSTQNTKQCAADGEDPTCSSSTPSMVLNSAHFEYYNIFYTTRFCS